MNEYPYETARKQVELLRKRWLATLWKKVPNAPIVTMWELENSLMWKELERNLEAQLIYLYRIAHETKEPPN